MSGMISGQSIPGLVLLGIAVLVAVKLFYYGRDEQPEDALYLAMNVIGRVMIAVGLLEGCLLMLNWFAIVLAIAGAIALCVAVWRYHLGCRTALLIMMAAATRRFMPLAPAVEAFGDEWRGAFAWQARRFARLLAAGTPLIDALRQSPGLVSAKSLAVIEAGSEAGVPGAALDEAARLSAAQTSFQKALAPLWYFMNLSIAAAAILSFVMVKIVPALIKIFSDFDAELPWLTLRVIEACDAFVTVPVGPIALLLLGLAFIYLTLRYFGLALWDPPGIAGIVRRQELRAVLRTLAVVAEGGRPLEPALAVLARKHPNPSLGLRLVLVMADMQEGADWCDSFHDRGLLRADETAMLKSAARVGNLPWLLRETAAGIERKLAYRLQVVLQFVAPAAVLAFGGFVLCVVVGMYLPLVALIEKLL
ncbi:MAG TPA: type II secretion system F family protein [Pirellulales bacterium]|nr:type II secretion system F family protein [Pirellulales bacterium]